MASSPVVVRGAAGGSRAWLSVANDLDRATVGVRWLRFPSASSRAAASLDRAGALRGGRPRPASDADTRPGAATPGHARGAEMQRTQRAEPGMHQAVRTQRPGRGRRRGDQQAPDPEIASLAHHTVGEGHRGSKGALDGVTSTVVPRELPDAATEEAPRTACGVRQKPRGSSRTAGRRAPRRQCPCSRRPPSRPLPPARSPTARCRQTRERTPLSSRPGN